MRSPQVVLLFALVLFLTVFCKTVKHTTKTQTTKPLAPEAELNMSATERSLLKRIPTDLIQKNTTAFLALSALCCMWLLVKHYQGKRRREFAPDFREMDLGLIRIVRDNAGHILEKHRKQSKVIRLDDWM